MTGGSGDQVDVTPRPAHPPNPTPQLAPPPLLILRTETLAPEQTTAVGSRVGDLLASGDVVILDGALGAGKTAFIRGLAQALDVAGPVTSPTFVIARHHRPRRAGGCGLVHVDGFRVTDISEIDQLDLDTDLAEAVIAMEWGTGLAERLTGDRLSVRIRRSLDRAASWRSIEVHGHGGRWAGVHLP